MIKIASCTRSQETKRLRARDVRRPDAGLHTQLKQDHEHERHQQMHSRVHEGKHTLGHHPPSPSSAHTQHLLQRASRASLQYHLHAMVVLGVTLRTSEASPLIAARSVSFITICMTASYL